MKLLAPMRETALRNGGQVIISIEYYSEQDQKGGHRTVSSKSPSNSFVNPLS